jgi:hypothetical protein
MARQIDDDDDYDYDDYDYCYECSGLGDDYYIDADGDLVCYCPECSCNPDWRNNYEQELDG